MTRPLSSEYSLQLGFSFNKRLGSNLELWRNAVMNQDIDFVMLVDGKEGSGKSVFGMQIAYFLDIDHEITFDQICYYPEQVKKAIMSLKPGKAIVWDEARRGLNRRRHAEEVNQSMLDLFAECRQHNLFLVVIMPSFYDMDMNIAVWRSRALCHVWYNWDLENRDKPLVRGFFRFYNEEAKKHLYTDRLCRQAYKYPYLHNDCFDGVFSLHYVVDEGEYRRLKADAEKFFRKKEEGGLNCPVCGSSDTRFREKEEQMLCRKCGNRWVANIRTGASP